MLPRSLAAMLAAPALAWGGCGGDSGNADRDKEAAVSTYRSFLNAFATGDGQKACQLLSERGVQRMSTRGRRLLGISGCAAAITDGIQGLPELQRKSHEWSWRRTEIVNATVTGDVARLTLRLPIGRRAARGLGADADSLRAGRARLVKQDGDWKVDVLR